ncbi:MAG: NADH-quinone oxidoreductase subunit A [Pyrinomonadaceae bacterium]
MTEFRLMDYVPIVLMFIVAGGFAVTNILLTQLVGPRKSTKVKLMPYECGKDPVGSARERFSVKFYSVAVDFLLFDLEVLFLIPFAVAFGALLNAGFREYALPAYIAVMVFIGMVIIGFVYAWKKGTFDWNIQARAEARAEAKALFAERKKRRAISTQTGMPVEPVTSRTQPTLTSRV